MTLPLCFVLMPFGRKPGAGGAMIDFDSVYQELIPPAVKAVGMEAIRADQELTGGIIHKPICHATTKGLSEGLDHGAP